MNLNCKSFYKDYLKEIEDDLNVEVDEKSGEAKNVLLGYLNVGSNFNHISAILSHQCIFNFCAVGK